MKVRNVFGEHELLRFDYRAARTSEAGLTRLHDDALAAIDAHGFVVIENAVSPASCDRLRAEMQPYIDATPHGLHGLGGTRRTGALVARSPASHEMIAHPAILALVASILGEQRLSGDNVHINGRSGKGRPGFRYPWQLHLTQIIDVGPDGGTEAHPHALGLHRANGMWVHDFAGAGISPQLEVMWALSDFTDDNGATHVVLGSHHDEPRGGTRGFGEPTIQAQMPKGSALLWSGWSIHGAGVNRTAERRVGMNINYALAFLAQEENQLLACPPELARRLPGSLQDIIGYRQPGVSLNYVAECQAPKDSVLRDDFDVLIPGAHGHVMDPAIDGPGYAPVDDAALAAKKAELEAAMATALAGHHLEQALRYQKSLSVLLRSSQGRWRPERSGNPE